MRFNGAEYSLGKLSSHHLYISFDLMGWGLSLHPDAFAFSSCRAGLRALHEDEKLFKTAMDNSEMYSYRRRLPHFRNNEKTYFVSWRVRKSERDLSADERQLVHDSLLHFDKKKYDIKLFVVMNDHVHVLARPYEEISLEKLVHSWKSFSANRMQRQFGRKGGVWQQEYFDRIVRGEPEFIEMANYIIGNPIKRWPDAKDYAWLYIQDD